MRWRKCRRNYWPALSGVLGTGRWGGREMWEVYSGRPECVGCCEGEGILLEQRVVGKYDYVGEKF